MLELCAAPPSDEQQLLLCSVTAPLHGDGMATLLRPMRSSGAPSSGSGLGLAGTSSYSVPGGSFVSVTPPQATHTAAGVPLAALVADGGSAASDAEEAVADQSFCEFARNLWPGIGESGKAE